MSVYSRRVWVVLTASLCLAMSARGGIVTHDVTGTESWDLLGDPDNTVVVLDMAAALGLSPGTSITITGIGWDVSLSTVGTSWLSEIRANFNNSSNNSAASFNLIPGAADGFPGSGSYASSGIVDLVDDAGLSDLVLPDGLLRLEFFDSYEDYSDAIDGYWDSGTLSIETLQNAIPAPASAALALPALLILSLRRRMF